MAKKTVSRKRYPVASSPKTVKSSGKISKAPQRSSGKSTPKKVTVTAKSNNSKSKKISRISYKQEYVKLLQRTNKAYRKDIKAIRKAIEQPEYIPEKAVPFEAFPYEPPVKQIPSQDSIEEQILAQLQDIELTLRSRDMAFEDLVAGSGKLGGGFGD